MVGVLKRGRKPLPKEEVLSRTIYIRVTQGLQDEMNKLWGRKNVSMMIRNLLEYTLANTK